MHQLFALQCWSYRRFRISPSGFQPYNFTLTPSRGVKRFLDNGVACGPAPQVAAAGEPYHDEAVGRAWVIAFAPGDSSSGARRSRSWPKVAAHIFNPRTTR